MASKTRTRKPRLSRSQVTAEALRNAVTRESTLNYEAIFEGFEAMGIPMEDVHPRENVFTFNAWRALGRVVRKGEHGVAIVTVIPCRKLDRDTGELVQVRKVKRTTVFHVTQTEAFQLVGQCGA